MSTYAVIYEEAPDRSWGARAVDLPVFAVGDTRQEAESEIRSAIALYLEELTRSGEPAPKATTTIGTVSL